MKNTFIAKALSISLLAACLWYISAFYYISFARIGYKFELEWMEGSILDHARVILNGGNIFCRPSVDFTPFIYSPLYYVICAPVLNLFDNGFLAMRLVSLLSFSFTLFIIYRWVLNETGDRYHSLFSIALFSACFEICGSWYDIARVDSLALLLIVSFFYIVKFGGFKYNQIIAALVLTLACLCKQSNIIAAAPFLLYSAFKDFKKNMPLLAVSFFSLSFAALVLNSGSDYLFSYYSYFLPSMHAIDKSLICGFWLHDLLPEIPFMIALSAFYLMKIFFIKDGSFNFYASLTLGLILSSWLPRIHEGGYLNVLMPACAVFSILTALALKPAFDSLKNFLKPAAESALPASLVRVLLMAQFLFLLYNPFIYIPSDEDLAEGAKLIDKISSFKGEVYIPYHPYLTLMAGKKGPMAHHMAIFDILRGDKGGKNFKTIDDGLNEYIAGKKAEVIIIDNLNFSHIELVKKYYNFKSKVFNSGYFYPVCGMKTRPEFIFVKK